MSQGEQRGATNDWARTAETVAGRVAPDFAAAGVPLYCVRQSTLPREGLGLSRSGGIFAASLDLELREAIGSRWQGRGAAVLVNDSDGEFEFESDAVRLSLHEFSHAVHHLDWLCEPPPPAEAIAKIAAGRVERLTVEPSAEAWLSLLAHDFLAHDLAFIRAMCHVSARAGQLNRDWATPYFPRTLPGLVGVTSYVRAFEGEAVRRAHWPIREILATAPPEAASALWRRDLEKFEEYQHAGYLQPPRRRFADRAQVAVGGRKVFAMNEGSMKPVSVAAKLADELRQREAIKSGAFRDLVADIAVRGRTPKVDAVERILAECGKTAEDLQDAVAKRSRRVALREQVSQEAIAEKRIAEIERLVDAAREELGRAEERYQAAVTPLAHERQALAAALSAAMDARNELARTCDDPTLTATLADFQNRIKELQSREREVEHRIEVNQSNVAIVQVRLQSGRQAHPEDRENAKVCEARIVELRKELAALVAERQAVHAEEEKARERLLEP